MNNIFSLRLFTYSPSVSDKLLLCNVQRAFGFHSVHILCTCPYLHAACIILNIYPTRSCAILNNLESDRRQVATVYHNVNMFAKWNTSLRFCRVHTV